MQVYDRSVGEVSETKPAETAATETGDIERSRDGAALSPGDTLGRYIVRRPLGAGGMGEVYSAFDLELDREVAVKVLRADVAGSNAAGSRRARLVREAQTQAKLSHPNVISVLDVGTVGDQVFVAMEYVEGTTLGTWTHERGWRQVLRAYHEAGRGLAAAHHVGLIHRDFKPDNVLVGRDGRIRVTDFGLARAIDAEDADGGGSGDPISVSLTVTGSVLGTPRYMAPEQHRGERAGTRSDQFSFCVALYEALYGSHPFAAPGADSKAMKSAVCGGELREASGTEVPSWVRRVVLRGLSPDVDERFPDMDALLAELMRDPIARRRRRLVAGGAVVVVAGVSAAFAFLLATRGGSAPACSTAGARFAEVWNDEVRATARAAFEATGLDAAVPAFDRAAADLDRYAQAWVAERDDACQATMVREEQTERLMDLRVACLDERLAQAAAVVALFVDADRPMVSNAIDAVGALRSIAACGNADALTSRFDPPGDDIADSVATERERLAEAKANESAGRFDTAREVTTAVVARSRALGYRPLEAEAVFQLANLQRVAGELDEAAKTLDEAARVAAAAGHVAIAAEAWSTMVWVVGYRQEKYDEGHKDARHAEAHLELLGNEPEAKARLLSNEALIFYAESKPKQALALYEQAIGLLEHTESAEIQLASVLNNLGGLYQTMTQFDQAEIAHQRALEIRIRKLGEKHPHVAASLNNLGQLRDATGDYETALGYYRRAIAIGEAIFGPRHESVALYLQNLGEVLRKIGKGDEALASQQRALEIRLEVFGEQHPDVAASHETLANAFGAVGRLDEAVTHYEQALKIREALGAKNTDLATIHNNLGTTERNRKNYDAAMRHFDQAKTIFIEAAGADHPYVGVALFNIANVQSDRGDLTDAHESYQQALSIMETKLGAEHPFVAYPLTGMGENLRRMKKYARAVAPLERALRIREATQGEPLTLATTRFHLGQVLWELGRERKRAHALVTAAESDLKVAGGAGTDELEEVSAWLGKHLAP